MLVILNTQHHESTLKKKSNYICYHGFCDYDAIYESLTGNFGTNENCADLATNVFYGGYQRFHVSNFLYNKYDDL